MAALYLFRPLTLQCSRAEGPGMTGHGLRIVVASRFRLGPGQVLCLLGFCHAWSMTLRL